MEGGCRGIAGCSAGRPLKKAVKKVKKGLAISREIDYNVVRFIIFLTN